MFLYIYINIYIISIYIIYIYILKTGPIANQLKLNFGIPRLRICNYKSFPVILRVEMKTWGLEED